VSLWAVAGSDGPVWGYGGRPALRSFASTPGMQLGMHRDALMKDLGRAMEVVRAQREFLEQQIGALDRWKAQVGVEGRAEVVARGIGDHETALGAESRETLIRDLCSLQAWPDPGADFGAQAPGRLTNRHHMFCRLGG
jgi:hypothetical protein